MTIPEHEKSLVFSLKRPARKSGGDRYETYDPDNSSSKPFVIYIPQNISRVNGKVANQIEVTFRVRS